MREVRKQQCEEEKKEKRKQKCKCKCNVSKEQESGECQKKNRRRAGSSKRTTPGIPTWSPTVVLTGPEHA